MCIGSMPTLLPVLRNDPAQSHTSPNNRLCNVVAKPSVGTSPRCRASHCRPTSMLACSSSSSKAPPAPPTLSNTAAGSYPTPVPKVRTDQPRYPRRRDPQRLPRRAGTRSTDLQAWKPFPVTASDKGAGRSHKLNIGHVIREMAVENSWRLRDGRSLRTSCRVEQKTAVVTVGVRPAARAAFAGSCRMRMRGRNGAGN
jgi:hypothetical protein